jgi:hypothetical protein
MTSMQGKKCVQCQLLFVLFHEIRNTRLEMLGVLLLTNK